MQKADTNYQIYLELLDDLSGRLTSNPLKNIEFIVKYTHKILGGVCSLYNKLNNRDLSLVSWAVENGPDDLPYSDNAVGHICYEATIKGGQAVVVINDISKTEYLETDPYVKKYNLKSYLGSPVTIENQSIGSLCIVDNKPRIFNDEEIVLIKHMTTLLRVEEEKYKIDITQNILYKITRSLLSSNNIHELSLQIRKHLEEIINIDKFMLLVYDPADEMLKFYHTEKQEPLKINTLDYFLTNSLMQSRKSIFLHANNINDYIPENFHKDITFHSWIGVPLKIDEKIIGVISLQTNESFSYIKEDLELLEFISYEIAHILKEKKLKEDLKLKELDYRTIFEQATVGIYRTDFEGNILMANPAIIKMLGYDSFDEIAKVKLTDTYAPDYLRKFFLEKLKKEKIVSVNETLWKTKHNECIVVNETAQLVHIRGKDIIEGTVIDITEKIKNRNAYEFEKKKFQVLSKNLPVAILQVDKNHKIVYQNEKVKTITGYDSSDIEKVEHLYTKLQILQKYTKKYVTELKEESNFFIITTKDGNKKHVKITKTKNIKDKYLVIIEDIDHMMKSRQDLEIQSHYLTSINSISNLLISTDSIPFDKIIQIIGETIGVERSVYLETRFQNKTLHTNRIADWQNNKDLKFASRVQSKLNISEEFPNWFKKIKTNDYLAGNQQNFFDPELSFLQKNGIGAILFYAIKVENKIKGLFVLETKDRSRVWQNHELIFLRSVVSGLEKIIEKNIMTQLLENSKSSYMELFKKSSSGIIIFNENSFIENINPRAELFFNKDKSIIGQTVDILSSDSKIINTILDSIKYCSIESQSKKLDLIIKNGTESRVLDLYFSKAKYFDKSCVIMYAHDITKRYENEQQVKESLKEKHTLLQEIHHRVKNNLQVISSLLNLQLKDIESEKDRQLFMDSQNRIKSIALIHESLYHTGNLSKINFRDYTEKLISRLFTIFHTDHTRIKYNIDIPNIEFGLKKAIPCGLILDELITNSLKYAFPNNNEGKLSISLLSIENNQILLVKDNGIGFDSSNILKNKTTLGFELVTTLVKQLKGTYRLFDDNGFGIEITFPE